ncbi:unnamed protein product [Lactuca saligna]|uniref:Uncharacterized protein n=1 Tax=Lactuca saligna TaxID=75948 RepID=A0AA35V7Q7_LACSI|nr:unnamed protein product [Lactuca saligna]
MIVGDTGDDDDLGGFTYSPFQIRTESEYEASVSKGKLKSIHEKLDQLLLASKASSTEAYSKATVELLTTYNNNISSMNEALQNLGAMLKTEKINLEKIRTGLQQDHSLFQTSLTSQITKLQDDLAMENKVMDALAKKTEKKEPKGTEKLIEDEPIIDDDEDKEHDEAELKRRKARDAELNETQRIMKEAEEKEKVEKEAHATLKSKMFCALVKVVNVPFTDSNVDQLLFSFYLKHMKPQYKTWSAHKIVAVKVTRLIETESFPNSWFKVVRGSSCQAYEFNLANLPSLNPNYWIILYNMLLRVKEKYGHVMFHIQLMIKSCIQEVGSMDVDIATVLKKKTIAVPKEAPKDFRKLSQGRYTRKDSS